MRTWHTYPTYLRLVDASHVPIVLILEPGTRGILAAAVADPPETVHAWMRELTCSHGLPDALVHLDSPAFTGLKEALTDALSEAGYRYDADPQVAGDDLVWVLTEGGRISKAVQQATPHTVHDVAVALHDQLTHAQGDRA